MAFWTYLLRCDDGRYYTGQTDDPDRRMSEHQAGGFCDFTSRRSPVVLAWWDSFQTRGDALAAERRIGGRSRAKKEALIRSDWAEVARLARPQRQRFSTSLETNGGEARDGAAATPPPLSPVVTGDMPDRGHPPAP